MAKSRKKETHVLDKEIKGIVLFTVGVLMIISVFSPSSAGIIGRFIKKILIAVFGIGSYILPFLIIFIGCCCIVKKNKINFNKKFYGILLFIINTLLFIQLIVMSDYYVEDSLISGIQRLYESNTIFHGGIISFLIDVPLFKLFGKTDRKSVV